MRDGYTPTTTFFTIFINFTNINSQHNQKASLSFISTQEPNTDY